MQCVHVWEVRAQGMYMYVSNDFNQHQKAVNYCYSCNTRQRCMLTLAFNSNYISPGRFWLLANWHGDGLSNAGNSLAQLSSIHMMTASNKTLDLAVYLSNLVGNVAERWHTSPRYTVEANWAWSVGVWNIPCPFVRHEGCSTHRLALWVRQRNVSQVDKD